VASTSQLPKVSAKKKSGKSNGEESDVIVFDDQPTPVKSQRKTQGSGAPDGTPVASIFGGMKRKESEEESRDMPKRGIKRPAGGEGVKREKEDKPGLDKKAKQNPLLANQP